MTACYYCPQPIVTGAHFAGGEIRGVCERHYLRHLERADASALVAAADRDFRKAVEAYTQQCDKVLVAALSVAVTAEVLDKAREVRRRIR